MTSMGSVAAICKSQMEFSMRFRCLEFTLYTFSIIFLVPQFGESSSQLPQNAALTIVCSESNDLHRVLRDSGIPCMRYDGADEAVRSAAVGSGILLLADGYPDERLKIIPGVFDRAREKKLRLFIEYPDSIPGISFGPVRKAGLERGVISSDIFGERLPQMRIVTLNGCRFLPARIQGSHIAFAKVAGYDRAVYGLPDERYPILFLHPQGDILIASTKLSDFVSGRFAPAGAWGTIWRGILGWLAGGETIPELVWEAAVRTAFTKDEPLADHAFREAIIRGTDWFQNARLLIHPSYLREAEYRTRLYPSRGPAPSLELPSGDGTLGVMEGFASSIDHVGSQEMSWWIRDDCCGETAMAHALRFLVDGDENSRAIARNLLNFIYIYSDLQGGPRGDVNGHSFGLLDWATTLGTGTYYGDDNARALLGSIAVSAALGTDRWDDMIVRAIIANFRTTGPEGFRGSRLREPELQKNGWRYYWESSRAHYAPHFESWIWACYLWLYHKTGYVPFLERTRTGIRMMMEAYPDKWEWTNGIQQERARMLLPLAWLVRVEDTAEHRRWIDIIAADLIADQVSCGAIREELGREGMGKYSSPRSNEEYGTNEATLLQENGDPAVDLLYTSNFAFFSLHEAARATGDGNLERAAQKLGEFLVKIQVRSSAHPEFDGAWYRGFDFEKWEYWGSNADAGWGPWCTETGWTQGWIVSVLALRQMNTSLWELSEKSGIAAKFPIYRDLMLPR